VGIFDYSRSEDQNYTKDNNKYVPVPPCHQFIHLFGLIDVVKEVENRGVEPMRVGDCIGAREGGTRGQCKADLAMGVKSVLRGSTKTGNMPESRYTLMTPA
jgi:hypothetical protein